MAKIIGKELKEYKKIRQIKNKTWQVQTKNIINDKKNNNQTKAYKQAKQTC